MAWRTCDVAVPIHIRGVGGPNHFHQWLSDPKNGRCGSNYKRVILENILWIKFMSVSGEIALRWMPQNTHDDKSRLVQEMAWCHQAASHYLSQCWYRSTMLPYDVTRSKWITTAEDQDCKALIFSVVVEHQNKLTNQQEWPLKLDTLLLLWHGLNTWCGSSHTYKGEAESVWRCP